MALQPGADGPLPVLYVHHMNTLGGAEKSLLRLLECLDRSLVTPHLAAPPGEPLETAAADLDVPFHPVPLQVLHRTVNPFALAGQALMLRRAGREVAELAGELGAGLVHCNSLPALLAARTLGEETPVVWHARDLRLPGPVLAAALPHASLVLAISRTVADHLLKVSPAVAGKTAVVYNGLTRRDATLVRPREEVRQEWGIGPTTPVAGCVGQLVPWKRQDVFLRAGARLVAQVPDVRLVVVGGDPHGLNAGYVEELRNLAVHLGISDRVIWAGTRADMPDVLAALDVLIHPATQEPFGRTLLEAMAVGVPVVASNAAGPAEIISHGSSGLLTAPGEAESLYQGARKVLTDRLFADQLRGGGVRRARQFLARDGARLVTELYAQLLRSRVTSAWRWSA